ncbi:MULTISPECIES: DUF1003 domain-containing protein [unclassified Schaalia]|uniref:DUF1003 domain-containing protein n=1 Tax=unclassified Schaalia TaxID=2691889 RepID=UPI001E3E364E|nr:MULTISPECIES: DUF1003 domain-containing protein [unclassified Schaalia]MCD4549077.1 DUF1003 domain-containing protein [Schaalia sp. lx-260]MCD4557265.1 DUF1003 domain-containing protein [Schaalia sp. lx-100]
MADRLDTPAERRQFRLPRINLESERIGRGAELIARFSGTPQFLVYLTLFVVAWIGWNTLAPQAWQFDRADLGFTALTLMLSLQASYAAPLILLAQNRQDDRDRVQAQQDRQRAERNLSDTEYLTREIAGLRIAMGDMATRDFVRSELRDTLEELREHIERLSALTQENTSPSACGPDETLARTETTETATS